MSVTYIGPKSRTERPRKTKISTEVAHVISDSDPLSDSKGQRSGHQAALVGCSSHHMMYIDETSFYVSPRAQLVKNQFAADSKFPSALWPDL